MDTKKGSLEQSILDVWKEAAEELPVQPQTEHGSGEHAFEVGTKRFDDYTREITPGQVEEEIAELNALIEELEEGILGNIAKAAGKTVAKGAKSVAKKAGGAVKKKVGGSMVGRAYGKAKAGVQKAKAIGKKVKKAVKTGQAYGDQYNPMLEKLEIIESKLNNYCELCESLEVELPEAAVNPKEREDLGTEPSGTAKKQKKAKEPAPNQMTEAQSGDKEAYKKFFDAALKKFKVDSPADFKSDEEKKKFYDYIDKNWEGDNEKAEGAMSQVREFKIQNMKAALAQVWGMEEGKNPFKKEDDEKKVVKDGKTETGKKAAAIDLKPKIDD